MELALKNKVDEEIATLNITQFRWTGSTDLKVCCQRLTATIQVTKNDKYQTLDVDKTFKDLLLCGELLRAAYITAGEKPCSKQILKVCDGYQDLCNLCCVGSSGFVDSCVAALKTHSVALQALEIPPPKGPKEALAVKQFAKCAELARVMVTTSQKLEEETQKLVVLTSEALHTAKDDATLSAAQKAKLEQDMMQAETRKAALSAAVDELSVQLRGTREEEERVAALIKDASDKAHVRQMTATILNGVAQLAPMLPCVAAGGSGLGLAACAISAVACSATSAAKESASTGLVDAGKEAAVAFAGAAGDHGKAARLSQAKLTEATTEIAQLEGIDEGERTKEHTDRLKELRDSLQELKDKAESTKADDKSVASMLMAQAATLESKESLVKQRRRDLEDEMRKENRALAETLAGMKSMKTEKTQVEQTVVSLTTCVQALGKIVTTFKNVKLFWQCISLQSASVGAEVQGVVEAHDKDELLGDLSDAFKASAVNWATLGHMNLVAHGAMTGAKGQIDGFMQNLPDSSDPSVIAGLGQAVDNLLKSVMDDSKALEDR